VRGVEIGLAQFGMMLGIWSDRPHEAERFGDMVGELLVAFRTAGCSDETQHPSDGRFRDWQKPPLAKARSRLASPPTGDPTAARIRNARASLNSMSLMMSRDSSANLVALFSAARSAAWRIGRRCVDLPTGEAGGEAQHHGHLQENAEEIADIVGAVLLEASAQVAALSRKASRRDIGEDAVRLRASPAKHERRIRRSGVRPRQAASSDRPASARSVYVFRRRRPTFTVPRLGGSRGPLRCCQRVPRQKYILRGALYNPLKRTPPAQSRGTVERWRLAAGDDKPIEQTPVYRDEAALARSNASSPGFAAVSGERAI